LSRASGAKRLQCPDDHGGVLPLTSQDLLEKLTGKDFPFLCQDSKFGPMFGEVSKMRSKNGPESKFGILHPLGRIPHLPEKGSQAVIQDEEKEFFFAPEVVVETRRADASGGRHIPDSGVVETLLREDAARALKDLNQLLVVAFLSVYHLGLILGASLDSWIGKLPEAVWGCKEGCRRLVRTLQMYPGNFPNEVIYPSR
jgi:hypothetical protein